MIRPRRTELLDLPGTVNEFDARKVSFAGAKNRWGKTTIHFEHVGLQWNTDFDFKLFRDITQLW
jgi:hypothetical protein